MEENNPQQSFSQLCKLGCGYFGSSNFDGLCSQCYKDKQHQCGSDHNINDEAFTKYKEESYVNEKESVNQDDNDAESIVSSVKASTIEHSSSSSSFSSIVPTGDSAKADISSNFDSNSPGLVSKKNRCLICRKKLGLTGFDCRCGGQFCSTHRYSDSHSCTFDYKIEAENVIRKANPRIVSNKVSKI